MAEDRLQQTSSAVHEDEKLVELVRQLALKDYSPPSVAAFESNRKYAWLREAGSELWLDTGDASAAEKVYAAEISAMTTNNALVNQVIQTGVMDGLIAYGAREIREICPGISEEEVVVEIAFLVNAKLALSLVKQFGAHVSVELHPDLGFDTDRTLAFARRYYAINPDYFYIKVPMTPEGFVSVRKLSAEGIPANFTLGFSARQNYLAARYSNPAFVNVFLGRLNSLVEENSLGRPDNVGEKAALASDDTIKSIRASGACKTRQIAASIRSGEQVAVLAGADVLTIPPQHAAAYLEMDIAKNDVQYRDWRDLSVDLQGGGPIQSDDFSKLWEIDRPFVAFVDDVIKNADAINNGGDLLGLAVKHGVNLFHNWTADERNKLREQGKIPKTDEWPNVPIDDLMSTAALEFFAKDQVELDNRIRGLIA